jgi:Lrp/AsnC family transcriptional regulator, leucine-responsive regulatory protein
VRQVHELDRVDREILRLLEADARTPNSEIARTVGVSAVTVADRIARLRDIGLIERFTIHIDPGKLGFDTAAIVHFEPNSAPHSDDVGHIANHPAVRSCYKITGDALLLLVLRVRDSTELNSVLIQFNEYGRTHSSLILTSELEQRPWFNDWPSQPMQALVRRTRGY